MPAELHSDKGRNFRSCVVHEVCNLLRITRITETAQYTQSDGMAEQPIDRGSAGRIR